MAISNDSPSDVNQQDLHGLYNDEARLEHAVYMDGARKALGLGKSGGKPMDVSSSTQNGMGWRELAVVGAIVVGSLFAMHQASPDATTQPTPAPQVSVPDTEYEVRFFDADGNRIPIEHRPIRSVR